MSHADTPDPVGIASIGTYIPTGVETSRDIAEKSGFPEYVFTDTLGLRQKPIAAPGEHPSDMAIKAALRALDRAEIRPQDIDMLIYGSSGPYDYGLWSISGKVQDEIGAVNAFCFELRNGCNSGNLGLYLASRHLMADPDLRCALVVCSDLLSSGIDYTDDQAIAYFTGADGASAAVLIKGHPDNRPLAYAGISDGSVADAMMVPLGGTRVPATQENVSKGLAHPRVTNPVQAAYIFSELYAQNYERVVREAMRKCGHSIEDIRFLFTNQVRKKTLDAVLSALGVPPEKTYSTMERYGHLSASDTLLALSMALENGAVEKGDLLVLASSSTGFHWGATVVEH